MYNQALNGSNYLEINWHRVTLEWRNNLRSFIWNL